MVRDYSFVNKALFPAPPSSYEQHDFPLIWLRTQERDGDDVCLALHQLAQPDSSRPIVLYCHGNGEDIGQSYSMFRRRMRDWDVSDPFGSRERELREANDDDGGASNDGRLDRRMWQQSSIRDMACVVDRRPRPRSSERS